MKQVFFSYMLQLHANLEETCVFRWMIPRAIAAKIRFAEKVAWSHAGHEP